MGVRFVGLADDEDVPRDPRGDGPRDQLVFVVVLLGGDSRRHRDLKLDVF